MCLARNKPELFWKAHAKRKPGADGFFSDDFKTLCEGIWKLDPAKRFTMDDILSHPWMQGETSSQESIQKEFSERLQKYESENGGNTS